jgi:hypothetical protein
MTRSARQAAAALKAAAKRRVAVTAPPEVTSPVRAAPGPLVTVGLLLAILAVAAVLRIAWLTSAPPGLNQDEAVNAWNAWCLLKTGKDQTGASWPLMYLNA